MSNSCSQSIKTDQGARPEPKKISQEDNWVGNKIKMYSDKTLKSGQPCQTTATQGGTGKGGWGHTHTHTHMVEVIVSTHRHTLPAKKEKKSFTIQVLKIFTSHPSKPITQVYISKRFKPLPYPRYKMSNETNHT